MAALWLVGAAPVALALNVHAVATLVRAGAESDAHRLLEHARRSARLAVGFVALGSAAVWSSLLTGPRPVAPLLTIAFFVFAGEGPIAVTVVLHRRARALLPPKGGAR